MVPVWIRRQRRHSSCIVKWNSPALSPCGYTAASVPKATFTPAANAFPVFLRIAAITSRIFCFENSGKSLRPCLLHVFARKSVGTNMFVFLQRSDRRVVHQVAMLDRINTGLRKPSARLRRREHARHAPAEPVRVANDGPSFLRAYTAKRSGHRPSIARRRWRKS